MITILKFLVSLVLLLLLFGAGVYFLPTHIKVSALEKISAFAPAVLKEKAEALLLTPPEQREKVIARLEANLDQLKNAAPETVSQVVEKSKKLIADLKEKNEAASLMEILETKLVDRLINAKKDSNTDHLQ